MARRSPRLLLLIAVLACAPSAAAQAPPEQCNILDSQQVERRVDAGVPMIYVTGPFLIRCGGGEELRALSGTVNEWTREIELIGNVFFQDPTRTLTANQANYWASLGRLYATGNVMFTDREEGSTIRGPELEYFRAMEGRPEPQVNAGQRPNLTLRPRDAGPDAEPLDIDADRISIVGNDNLAAYGRVVIRRTDLHATAGEAHYDGVAETLDLRQNARIRSEEFNLSGEIVNARLPQGELEYVRARQNATLVGEELRVDAPELQLFFAQELLQRAVARGEVAADGARTGRAIATAREFRLEGDSIDALTPGQRVDRVIAVGRARGESIETLAEVPAPADLPEDGAPPLARAVPAAPAAGAPTLPTAVPTDRDWILGDTIIGYFEYASAAEVVPPVEGAPVADVPEVELVQPADTGAVLRRIVAIGMAQSLYRAERAEGAAEDAPRGLNFLAGERIELTFEEGDLQVAEVAGLRRGLYLDPVPVPATPAGETATDQTAAALTSNRRGGR
jgi:hypothetical protein